jgi:nucleoside-diphosphate-sugar epimerase
VGVLILCRRRRCGVSQRKARRVYVRSTVIERRRFDARKVAVTGAGGFIGNAICRALAAEGAEVRGLELNPETAQRVREAGAEFQACDITDRPALDRALEGVEMAVHTAAHIREWGRMEDFVRVNVGGTVKVLDAAERAGAERVLHVSSVVVYGYDHPGEQDEDVFHRTYGIPYIDTKSASDALACRRGAVVIRPGDVYGPASVPWVLRPLELARAGQLAVPGKGDGIMLPLYIDDLVEAVALGLLDGKPGRPYAAWDGTPVTFEDYSNRLADMIGGRRARRLPRPLLTGVGATMEAVAVLRGTVPPFSRNAITFIDRRGTVSTRRIREELGWEPRVNLDEGMRRTEEWLRAEGLL